MNYGIYQGRGCQVRASSIGKESDIVVNGEYSLTF